MFLWTLIITVFRYENIMRFTDILYNQYLNLFIFYSIVINDIPFELIYYSLDIIYRDIYCDYIIKNVPVANLSLVYRYFWLFIQEKIVFIIFIHHKIQDIRLQYILVTYFIKNSRYDFFMISPCVCRNWYLVARQGDTTIFILFKTSRR